MSLGHLWGICLVRARIPGDLEALWLKAFECLREISALLEGETVLITKYFIRKILPRRGVQNLFLLTFIQTIFARLLLLLKPAEVYISSLGMSW